MAQRRILIADDESYVTQILALNLQRRGFAVAVAGDGQAAYELAMAQVPDLLITDYQMPVIDGLGLCARLKSNPMTAHVPILMLTARGHTLSADELASLNIRVVLPKPFSLRELFPKIERALCAPAAGERKAAG
jgi:DNA-binding response OmpR family regulator